MELDSTSSSARNWDFCSAVFMKDEEVNGNLQVRDDLDKKSVARAIYILISFILFSFER